MYFTPDGKYAIVVAERLRRLDFRNAHTFALHHSLSVPCVGIDHLDFSADGRYLLASCEFSGQLVKVDVRTERVLGASTCRTAAAVMPQDVKISPDGQRLLCRRPDRERRLEGRRRAPEGHRVRPDRQRAHGLYPSRDGKACTSRIAARARSLSSAFARRSGREVAHSRRRQSRHGRRVRRRQRCSGSAVATTTTCMRSRRATERCSRASRSAPAPTACASGRSRAATRSATPATCADGSASGVAADEQHCSDARVAAA